MGTTFSDMDAHMWLFLDLENDLIQFFSKNSKKITSGGLFLFLAKFGLISYFNFLQKIFM